MATSLRQQYLDLGSPATSRFSCHETEQLAWALYLRPFEAPDGTACTTEADALECCHEDDAVVYGRTGVRFAGTDTPPSHTLPSVRHGDS